MESISPATSSPLLPIMLRCRESRDRLIAAAESHKVARLAGFTSVRAAQIALCAAELASNGLHLDAGGRLTLSVSPDDDAFVLEWWDTRSAEPVDDSAALASRDRDITFSAGLLAIRRMATTVWAETGSVGTLVRVRFAR